jgi:putative Holliday junction resolvase
MPFVSLEDLPASGPLLGLDPGGRRIGLASCDARRALVSPVTTLTRGKFTADAAAIFAEYDSRGCVGLVIGLPLNMDGSEGPRAQSARAFGRNLLKLRDVPAAMHDERLSSVEAEDRLRTAGVRAARRGAVRDQVAAVLILESALARLAPGRPQS